LRTKPRATATCREKTAANASLERSKTRQESSRRGDRTDGRTGNPSGTVRRRGRRGGRAVAAVGVGQRLEGADPDVVARGLAAVGAAAAVVVAEAEGSAAEEAGAAHEEPARAHVDAAELVGVAEPRVVDGFEGHHPARAAAATTSTAAVLSAGEPNPTHHDRRSRNHERSRH